MGAFGAGDGKKRPASDCACMDGHHVFGCGYTQHVTNARFIDISAPSFGSGPPLPWPPVTKRVKYVAACFCPGVFVCFGVCCEHILTCAFCEQDVEAS